MGHLIKDSAPLELFAWLDPEAELPGWDVLTGNPFGVSTSHERSPCATRTAPVYTPPNGVK